MKRNLLGYDTTNVTAPVPTTLITDSVKAALRSRPGAFLSSRNLAAITGLSISQVNGAIRTLTKRGYVDRALPIAEHGYGRRSGQMYQWHVEGGTLETGGGVAHETKGAGG